MPANAVVTIAPPAVRPYETKNFDHLIGMPGFSEKLLKTHFKLYQGYVANTNALNEKLQKLVSEGQEKSPEYAEMRRRFGWEYNGMRLHELYFGNLGKRAPLPEDASLHQAIAGQWGSFDNWKKDFTATGAMRGIGWAILYQDADDRRLLNVWIDEHNVNHLAGGRPLLVLDVFEHAFMTDYGTDRAAYMKAFFENINWDAVSSRLA